MGAARPDNISSTVGAAEGRKKTGPSKMTDEGTPLCSDDGTAAGASGILTSLGVELV